MILALILGFAFLLWLELPGLIKSRHWPELAAYSILMALAFTVCLLYTLDVNVPNPVRDMQYYVKRLFPFGYN